MPGIGRPTAAAAPAMSAPRRCRPLPGNGSRAWSQAAAQRAGWPAHRPRPAIRATPPAPRLSCPARRRAGAPIAAPVRRRSRVPTLKPRAGLPSTAIKARPVLSPPSRGAATPSSLKREASAGSHRRGARRGRLAAHRRHASRSPRGAVRRGHRHRVRRRRGRRRPQAQQPEDRTRGHGCPDHECQQARFHRPIMMEAHHAKSLRPAAHETARHATHRAPPLAAASR